MIIEKHIQPPKAQHLKIKKKMQSLCDIFIIGQIGGKVLNWNDIQ